MNKEIKCENCKIKIIIIIIIVIIVVIVSYNLPEKEVHLSLTDGLMACQRIAFSTASSTASSTDSIDYCYRAYMNSIIDCSK